MISDNIVEVVSNYVVLTKAGQHYLGKCPHHDDPIGTLAVNTRTNQFYCYMCGKGGGPRDFEDYMIRKDTPKESVPKPKKARTKKIKPSETSDQ